MHLCEPFLSGAPSAYFGAPRWHRAHRLKSADLIVDLISTDKKLATNQDHQRLQNSD